MDVLDQFMDAERTEITDTSPTKVVSGWGQLQYLNRKAVKQRFNTVLNMTHLQEKVQLSLLELNNETAEGNIENVIFPISWSQIHNDTEIRFMFNWGNPDFAMLDISFADWDSLQSVTSEEAALSK